MMTGELPVWAAVAITLAVFSTLAAGLIVFLIAWTLAMTYILTRGAHHGR